jgi:antitoxin ParD1/3/4
MKNTSIILGDHFEAFIEAQVKNGRFGSSSETIRAGLRLLEERELKLAALQTLLIEGEESGTSKYSLQNLIKELDEQ